MLSVLQVHSGCDSWSYEQSLGFFKECLQIEQEIGIKVVHETHRQRVLYNPWITRDLLTALPNLKINADFSHFCVVAERVFDNGCNGNVLKVLVILHPVHFVSVSVL